MTPFTAIYRKEFQENRWLLLTVFSVCVTMILYGCVENSYNSVLRWLENAKLLGLCIVGAAAALSYATETEQKTAAFLRRIPVPGLTLLRAKLAWIVTVTLAVFVPLFVGHFIALHYRLPFGISSAIWLSAAFSMVAWGLLLSTICRSTLMAVLTTWLSQLVILLGLALLFPGTYTLPFFGNYYHLYGFEGFFSRFHMSGLLLPNLISVGILGVALYRAANFLDICERKQERGSTPVGDGAAKPGLLARLFGMETWGPFRALLWQSIRQSSTVLGFGVVVAMIFTVWNVFKGMEFVLMLSGGPMIDTYLYNISGFIYIAGCLIALGFSSAVFAQDQDNGQYRVLAQHGVSPNLVWWSRFLPFLFVYSLPVPMIVRLCHLYTHFGCDQSHFGMTVIPILLLYYTPLCFGTFYSIFFRDYIVNVFLVLISTAFMMPVIGGLAKFGALGSVPATVIVLLALLTASWRMTADWLREKPQLDRLPKPLFTLLVAYALSFVVFVFASLV